MCYHNGIRVSFECRLCTESFNKINDFIVHKKKKHFQEFSYATCIVFEEKIILNSNHSVDQPAGSGSGYTPSASTVQVKVEIPDDSNLSFDQESATETEISILVEPKLEPVIFECKSAVDETMFNFKQEIQPPKPNYRNPCVRLKRLSCKEIQKFTKGSANRDRDRHRHREIHVPSFNENNSTDTEAPQDQYQYQHQHQPTSTRTTAVSDNDSELRIKECKLCRKLFSTDQQLRNHFDICLLDKNKPDVAYCALCNIFFSNSQDLLDHFPSVHGHSVLAISEQFNDSVPAHVLASRKFGHRIFNLTQIIGSDSDTEANHAAETFRRLDQLENIPEDVKNGSLGDYPETETQDLTNRHFDVNVDVEVEQHFNFNSNNSNPFKCPEPNCIRSFKVEEGLTQHLKRHTGSGLFKCQVPDCGKSFIYEGALYNHQIVHSDSFPFKCTYPSCDQAFKMKISFFKHLKSHS